MVKSSASCILNDPPKGVALADVKSPPKQLYNTLGKRRIFGVAGALLELKVALELSLELKKFETRDGTEVTAGVT